MTICPLPPKATPEEVKKWMKSIDTNGDGVISPQELENAARHLELWIAGWRAKRVMTKTDLDHNGKIDTEDEFKKLLEHAQNHWGRAIHSMMTGCAN